MTPNGNSITSKGTVALNISRQIKDVALTGVYLPARRGEFEKGV